MKAFEVLKQACMTTPILVFTDYIEPFLLETDASKDRLGVALSQKQADRQYHPIVYGSRATWEQLSLHQTQVSGVKVGSYRTL